MKRPARSLHALISGLAISAAGLAALAAPAMAINPPPGAAVAPTSPTDATVVSLTWTASTPDPGSTVTGYEIESANSPGGPSNSSTSVDAATLSANVGTSAVGLYYLRVRALQDVGDPSDYSVVPLIVDRAPPTITTSFVGTPSNGFYPRPLTIKLTCGDDNGLPGGACADIIWNADGKNIAGQVASVTDVAGKTTQVTIPPFSVNGSPPTKPAPTSTGSLVGGQPTLTWLPSEEPAIGSGVDKYEVQWQEDDTFSSNGWKLLATVNHNGGLGEYKAAPSAWSGGPLPVNTLVRWRVVAVDNVGNRAASSTTGLPLTIDPTVPDPPVITGGPSQPTRDSSPTFTWTGDGARFQWSITAAGSATPLRGGAGRETSATIPELADGAYVLHVTQFTAAQRESAEASRSFAIDTTAPVAPTILTRPTFPAIGAIPTFTWAIEPGSYSRWSVVDSAGNLVYGPIDTPVTSAELPTLPEGPYSFRVQQFDVAGNASGLTSEAFTVLAPLVAPTPAQEQRTAFLAALPKQNALRLLPKAGKTLPTLRPVLRWKRGPRGTKLYNLQVFRVTPGKTAKAKPKVRKVLSRFPRGRAYRAPAKRLKAGTCYVWRVWPYTGTAFTRRPVGVSNFCVANKKVLRKRALRIRAAKIRAAKIRAAKLRAAKLRAARARR